MAKPQKQHWKLATAETKMTLPTLNQSKTSDTPNAPTGGFFTMQKLVLTEPLRTFNANMQMAMRRSQGTIPMNAMTKDVYSLNWSYAAGTKGPFGVGG